MFKRNDQIDTHTVSYTPMESKALTPLYKQRRVSHFVIFSFVSGHSLLFPVCHPISFPFIYFLLNTNGRIAWFEPWLMVADDADAAKRTTIDTWRTIFFPLSLLLLSLCEHSNIRVSCVCDVNRGKRVSGVKLHRAAIHAHCVRCAVGVQQQWQQEEKIKNESVE